MKYKFNDWMTPLDETKFLAFWNKVNEMARREFGVDQDGDCPVNVKLIDRTRFEGDHYQRIPYHHKFDRNTPHKDLVEHLSVLECNHGIAAHAMETFISLMRHWTQEQEEDKAKVRKPALNDAGGKVR